MMMMTVTFDKVLPSRPEDTVRCQQPQLSAPFPQKQKFIICDDLISMIISTVTMMIGTVIVMISMVIIMIGFDPCISIWR